MIPTRNRAKLLGNAIQSALNQTFEDFEIVVVDNQSTDETRQVVSRFPSSKIRYVKSDQSLSMPDNWEFAWTQARGKYISYLCDDDAYLPTTLEYLVEKAIPQKCSVMSWDLAVYTYPDWIEKQSANSLMIPVSSSETKVYRTESLAPDLVNFRVDKLWWPRMNNTCVEYSTLNQIRSKLGRLFYPLCPDYAFMNVVYHTLKEVCVVHRPLSVAGKTLASIGASQVVLGENETTKKFLDDFGDLALFEECKSKLSLVPNLIAMTVLVTNKNLKHHGYSTHTIDWQGCFANMAHALTEIKKNAPSFFDRLKTPLLQDAGNHSRGALQEVQTILEASGEKLSFRHRLSRPFGKMIQASETTRRLELLLRYGGNPQRSFRTFQLSKGVVAAGGRLTVDGKVVGTQSILDVTRRLNSYYEAYQNFKIGSVSDVFKDVFRTAA